MATTVKARPFSGMRGTVVTHIRMPDGKIVSRVNKETLGRALAAAERKLADTSKKK